MSISKSSQQATTTALPLSTYQYRIRVKAGDNWLLPGRKGSGKTFFGKRLLSSLAELYPTSKIYILDIKLRDFNDFPGIIQSDHAPSKSSDRVQVWQPVIEYPDEIEKWLYNVLHDPPAILFIDELLALCYGRKTTSEQYRRIQKLGRALPIATITATQELVEIPRNAIGQADHIARFRLRHPYEQRLMNTIMGSDLDEPVDKYGFF